MENDAVKTQSYYDRLFKMDGPIVPAVPISTRDSSAQRPMISNRAVDRNIPTRSPANDQNIPQRKPLGDDTIQRASIDRREPAALNEANESISQRRPSSDAEPRRNVQPRGERKPIDERRPSDRSEVKSGRDSSEPRPLGRSKVRSDRRPSAPQDRSEVQSDRRPSAPQDRSEVQSDRRPSAPQDRSEVRSDRRPSAPQDRSEVQSDRRPSAPQDRSEVRSDRRPSETALKRPPGGKFEPITTRRPSDDRTPITLRRPSDPGKYKIEQIRGRPSDDRPEIESLRRTPINASPRGSPRVSPRQSTNESPRLRRPEVVENDLSKKFAELDELVIPPVKKRLKESKLLPLSTRNGVSDRSAPPSTKPPQKAKSNSSGTESDREKSEESEPEMTEAERKEIENSRQDLKIKKQEKREADRKEVEMIQKERDKKSRLDKIEKSRRGSLGTEYTLVSTREADDYLLVPEYIGALIQTLKNDITVSPIPDDFLAYDLYTYWRSDMRSSFQDILIKLLKLKYLSDPYLQTRTNTTNIRFSVIEARDFVLKDGKPRSAYCDIEYGDFRSKMKMELFRTEVVESNFNPVWNQQMTIEIKSPNDQIKLKLYDKRKEQFLGQTVLDLDTIVGYCKRKGRFEEWVRLDPRGKNKDKYVGGEILVSATIIEDKSNHTENETFDSIMKKLKSFEVDNRSLVVILLRSCVMLDLYTPRESRRSLLSPESVNLLKLWAGMLKVSLSFQVIAYLKVLFEKYVAKTVSIVDVKQELETLYSFFHKDLAKKPKDVIMF
jgi:hypothetical protein